MRLTPAAVRELLDRHGITPSRALGQNFMVDPNTIDRIVRLVGIHRDDAVIEIGAGVGSLTVALAETGARVVALEADRHLLGPLREVMADHDVDIVHADAMTFDWLDHLQGEEHWKLVANLPYNVATPLVLEVLDRVPTIVELTFLVQREVAERLVAPAGSRTYGVPSLRVAYWATAEIVARIPATVFHPRPRVESALVQLVRRPAPAADAPLGPLFELIRAAFGQRRKMLRRSLGHVVTIEQFAAADVSPEVRPETLELGDWDRLARVVAGSAS